MGSNIEYKSLTCPVCDGVFSNISLLVQHMETHTGEKPCQCLICILFMHPLHMNSHFTKQAGHSSNDSANLDVQIKKQLDGEEKLFCQFFLRIYNEIKQSEHMKSQYENISDLGHVSSEDRQSEETANAANTISEEIDNNAGDFEDAPDEMLYTNEQFVDQNQIIITEEVITQPYCYEDMTIVSEEVLHVSNSLSKQTYNQTQLRQDHVCQNQNSIDLQTGMVTASLDTHDSVVNDILLKSHAKQERVIPKIVEGAVVTVITHRDVSTLKDLFKCSICEHTYFINSNDLERHMSSHTEKSSRSKAVKSNRTTDNSRHSRLKHLKSKGTTKTDISSRPNALESDASTEAVTPCRPGDVESHASTDGLPFRPCNGASLVTTDAGTPYTPSDVESCLATAAGGIVSHVTTDAGTPYKPSDVESCLATATGGIESHVTTDAGKPYTPSDDESCLATDAGGIENHESADDGTLFRPGDVEIQVTANTKNSSKSEELERLIASHSKNILNKCDLCGKKIVNLRRHMEKHLGEKAHKCHLCDKAFSQKYQLKLHIDTHKYNHTCPICNIQFTKLHNLQKHISVHTAHDYYELVDQESDVIVSTGGKQLICHVCGKSFPKLSALASHSVVHTGEKSHVCHVCGKRFSQMGYLKTHMNIHNGVKPHTCHVCQRGFTSKSSLTRHELIHGNELKFKCHVCNKKFGRSSYLKNHMMIHTGEKNHQCSLCEKRFGTHANLTRHEKTHMKCI